MKRALSLILTVCMLLSTVVFALPVSAANAVTEATVGRTFTSADSLTMDGTLDKVPHTYEAWIKAPTTGATGNIISNTIKDKWGGTNAPRMRLFIDENGAPNLEWYDEIKTLYEVDFDKVNVNTGAWTHLAIVQEADNTFSCYVNGTRYTTSYLYYTKYKEGTTDPIYTSFDTSFSYPEIDKEVFDMPLVIGGSNERSNPLPFTGEIAGVTMYADARTASEVAADMQSINASDADLLASYDLTKDSVNGIYKNAKSGGIDLIDGKQWLTETEMEAVRDRVFDENFERAYSFVVVGDTQMTTRAAPDKLPVLYNWIKNNTESKNIRYVIGVGDITDDDVVEQWDTAYNAITLLDGTVDYSLVTGNHDYYVDGLSFDKKFASHEPYASQFTGTRGGAFKEGSVLNTWTNVQFGNNEYVLINLEFGPTDEVLEWACDVVEANADKKVIVVTHSYLFPNGSLTDDDDAGSSACELFPDNNLATTPESNNGDDIWNEFVRKYENIEMVFSGHEMMENVVVNQRKGDKGNTVTEMLINPQGVDVHSPVGKGIIAILYFNEDGTKCELEYYSTVLDKYYRTHNQLTVDFTETAEADSDGWNGSVEAPKGSGSLRDPYLISNGGHLLWMAEMCDTAKSNKVSDTDPLLENNAHFNGIYFKQTNDIDLNGHTIQSIGYAVTHWESVGAFGGTYDGGGYKIYNGKISPAFTGKPVNRYYGFGLFSAIYGAEIKNLTLDDVEIAGQGITGGIVGIAYAPETGASPFDFNKITNCHITNSCHIYTHFTHNRTYEKPVANDNDYQVGLVGGIAGRVLGTTISYCSSDVEFNVGGAFANAGGIVSHAGYNSKVEYCKFTGGIKLLDNGHGQTTGIGGIVGSLSPQYSTAFANATAANMRGMLIIRNCYNSGYFKYTGSKAISGRNQIYGGILGSFSYVPKAIAGTDAEPYPFLIENCYNLYARECESVLSNCKFIIQAGIAGKGLSSHATNHGILYLKNCYSVDVAEMYRQGITEEYTGTNEYTHEITVGTTKRYDCLKVLDNSVGTKTATEIKVYTDAIDKAIAEYTAPAGPGYDEPAQNAAPDFKTNYNGTVISKDALLVTTKATYAALGNRVVESWDGNNYMFYAGINAFASINEVYNYCIANGLSDVDIIVASIPTEETLEMKVPSKVYAPNWNTKPYVGGGEGFDATRDYDVEWTENADYMDSQVIINHIIFTAATTAKEVGVYGFTITGIIYDTKREKSDTPTHITVKNVMKDGKNASDRAYIYSPTNKNTTYDKDTGVTANLNQRDRVDIINLYIRSAHTKARLIGEYTSAYTTFDGLFFDGVKAGMNDDITYIKQAAMDSLFTIKNSNISNWRKASPAVSGNGVLSFSGRHGTQPLDGQRTELLFENNVIKGIEGKYDSGKGAYFILWHPVGLTDFTFTDNYLEMPRNEAATSDGAKDTATFFYVGTTLTDQTKDLDSFNDITITDNIMIGMSKNISVGSNGTIFADFNFKVKDNFVIHDWVDDFADKTGDTVSVHKNHPRGGGVTTYYLDSAMTKKSNVIYDYTFGDNYVSDSDKKTIKPAGTSPVSYVENEGVYTYTADLTDIIKTSTYNTYTVGYGDTTATVSEKLVYQSDKKLDCDTPITLTVKSHDGTVTETWSFIPAQHSFTTKASNSQATPADCDNAATYYVQCDNCNAVHTTMTVVVGEKNGHSFTTKASNSQATPADCDNAATYFVQCDNCDAVHSTMTVPVGEKNGHSFTTKASNQQATPADCDNAATYFVQCDNCDAVHTTMTVPVGEKNGHAFNEKDSGQKADDATCKAPQKNHVQCDNCDAVSTDKTIDIGTVANHNYENYVSNNDATCQKNCTETGKCIWCEAPNTRDIADSKVNHKYENYVANDDATCQKNETETGKCKWCEAPNTRDIPDSKAEHKFENYVSDNNATCQKNCTETAKCKWCDEKDTRDIADSKVDHKFENYVSDNNATCCKDGTKTAKCKWCDEKDTVADANTAKGHGDTTKVFKDVAAGKWYVNAINYNYTHKFISGMSETEFGVNTEVTRGMFITILARIAGVDTSDNKVTTRFTDVESGKYFTAAIKWASENKIVNGMTATTFAPNAPIQRQQLCVMIVNFAKHQKIELTASEKAISFKDAAAIGNYAKDAVATCQMADIVNGYANGNGFDFKPTNTATRAEAAQILYKFHKDFVGAKSLPLEGKVSAKLTDEVSNGTMWAAGASPRPTITHRCLHHRRGGHWPPESTTGTVPVVENIYGTHRRLHHRRGGSPCPPANGTSRAPSPTAQEKPSP